jgi:hypothetical protein
MSGRPVGRPSGQHLVDGHRTACRTPLHPVDGIADGHPTAGRPLRPSVGWQTALPFAGRGGGRPASERPRGRPGGSLRLGRPPGAVRLVETLEAHNY